MIKCSFCDEPQASFIGPESKPWANFCHDHGAKFTKANAKRRGRMVERARTHEKRKHVS